MGGEGLTAPNSLGFAGLGLSGLMPPSGPCEVGGEEPVVGDGAPAVSSWGSETGKTRPSFLKETEIAVLPGQGEA